MSKEEMFAEVAVQFIGSMYDLKNSLRVLHIDLINKEVMVNDIEPIRQALNLGLLNEYHYADNLDKRSTKWKGVKFFAYYEN